MRTLRMKQQVRIPYTSIVDAIIDMHTRGFSADFNMLGDQLFCAQTKSFLSPEQFDVLEMHSFDTDARVHGETVVYGIESGPLNMRGILFQSSRRSERGVKDILMQKVSKFWQ